MSIFLHTGGCAITLPMNNIHTAPNTRAARQNYCSAKGDNRDTRLCASDREQTRTPASFYSTPVRWSTGGLQGQFFHG